MPDIVSLSVERNLPARMRDDVTLYSDLHRPGAPGRYPVLLMRTPYDKASHGVRPFVVRAATAGYAVVVQDTRGRYSSEGPFRAFVHERQDGEDTLEWLASQPWCDGNVGMFGGSYVGLTQWQAAMSGHPALKAIAPNVTASNYHDGWTYQGGAFELSFNMSWSLGGLALDTALRANSADLSSPAVQAILDATDRLPDEFKRLPLAGHPLLNEWAPYYDEWVNHPTYDEYWESLDVSRAWDRMSVPSLNLGGWYDIFLQGTIDNFSGMRAAHPRSRDHHRLIVGPWNHDGMGQGNPIGSWDFGRRSTGGLEDIDGVMLRWFDRWLRGVSSAKRDAPVRIFTMGSGAWQDAEDWPLPGTDEQRWFLHSAGRANTLSGDGTLDRDSPSSEPPDAFVYNPRNPTPTLGGALCCNSVASLGGVYDQRPVEARDDVLVYTTPPLERPLEVTGRVRAVLYAASSATDTDFTAKLVDVHPCGYARNLTDGILRARYRESMQAPTLIEPNEVVRYEIDMWSTSNVFQPGHQIRIEISSSNFPRFDRNPNTGELPGRSSHMLAALQTIHHSSEYPSHVVLPVIER